MEQPEVVCVKRRDKGEWCTRHLRVGVDDRPCADERLCDCGKPVPDDEHHCWEHHVNEYPSVYTVPYRVCPECWHVFVSEQDLIAAYYRERGDVVAGPIRGTEIYSCPFCIHDF